MGINVLSLFDGMSCGRIALERAGIEVDNYFASEIDPYAIKVAKANYPDIIHLGDVLGWESWNLPKIDLVIGGSPCQGFSFAGKQLNFDDERSKLFFKFADILKSVNPEYFLLENVKMKAASSDVISSTLGVSPHLIESDLFSAQKRSRLYWTNIDFDLNISDANALLSDIIDSGYVDREKSFCLDANYYKGGNLKSYFEKRRRQLVFESEEAHRECLSDPSCRKYRKLSPAECERLQTVPVGYTSSVSNTQRYKMLGNGWTVDVIAHIFKGLKEADL